MNREIVPQIAVGPAAELLVEALRRVCPPDVTRDRIVGPRLVFGRLPLNEGDHPNVFGLDVERGELFRRGVCPKLAQGSPGREKFQSPVLGVGAIVTLLGRVEVLIRRAYGLYDLLLGLGLGIGETRRDC